MKILIKIETCTHPVLLTVIHMFFSDRYQAVFVDSEDWFGKFRLRIDMDSESYMKVALGMFLSDRYDLSEYTATLEEKTND